MDLDFENKLAARQEKRENKLLRKGVPRVLVEHWPTAELEDGVRSQPKVEAGYNPHDLPNFKKIKSVEYFEDNPVERHDPVLGK